MCTHEFEERTENRPILHLNMSKSVSLQACRSLRPRQGAASPGNQELRALHVAPAWATEQPERRISQAEGHHDPVSASKATVIHPQLSSIPSNRQLMLWRLPLSAAPGGSRKPARRPGHPVRHPARFRPSGGGGLEPRGRCHLRSAAKVWTPNPFAPLRPVAALFPPTSLSTQFPASRLPHSFSLLSLLAGPPPACYRPSD